MPRAHTCTRIRFIGTAVINLKETWQYKPDSGKDRIRISRYIHYGNETVPVCR